ncbi:hypothetical protein MAC_08457 [Metarhizium acridum CQMa 102]|uniref:Transcription factor domain-containing protein n=1 Tax=Metarhizium acridum (strain CQMa 102) TaxID=655827 RepID=E9EF09_METAQ|nr:uncharacterized protein MAC_08457 [Metarhizium acridum CQMa 102]EFY85510.1 hypothetical protein MAC_08457 [Metarhizium acridum CQMa 102]
MDEPNWTRELLQSSSLYFEGAKQSDGDFLMSESGSIHQNGITFDNLEQARRRCSQANSALAASRQNHQEPRNPPRSRTGSGSEENNSPPQSDQSPMVSTPLSFTSLSDPLPNVYRSRVSLRNSGSLAEIVKHSTTGPTSSLPGLVCIDDAIRMTVEYPLRMLADTFRSPFIHPKLARECPKGMPQPIAEALACVGMKMHSEQPGLQFVCDVFQDQRDKLIKEIPSTSDRNDLEGVCALLHAMCIYQIEGLLSDNRYSSKLATAVLHHEYLVRATRRLLIDLEKPVAVNKRPYSVLSSPTPASMSWSTWLVHESLRRTVFLIFIIHHLLGVAKILDPAYFEPLFPQDLFDAIQLPSDESLWLGESEEEWHAIRRALRHTDARAGPQRLRLAVSLAKRQKEISEREGGTVNEDDEPGDASFLERLPEVSRLIVSVASLNVRDM